ncbi:MAG: PQQ-binding-like beta-propeller repeat protein [Bryobacterales bacterium]|nr:PQQ-binding-like beta-propeller repeat protein [Bryobacterales bacterium]
MNVLNVNYDTHQTGANLQETSLTPKTDWSNFGKVGTYPVDGQVYTQPLYVSGVAIGGKNYNVVYIATMQNSVYAFDADNPQSTTPLWQVNLGAPVPVGLFNFSDILPVVGILGTPAIDATKQVLYAVADVLPSGASSTPIFEIHAISLIDGHEMFGAPVEIEASVPGSGAGSANGAIAFDALQQLQRPGLMLANGNLYIAFGSHADAGNYHGWMFRYDASTLEQMAVFNSSPGGRQAAFWHSGRAPAIDGDGDVFAVTGNGDWDGTSNFGESVLHLAGADLSLLDWYTPEEWSSLNDQDEDVGATGAILIPGINFLLAGGKSGLLYLVNYDSMGHLGPDTTSTVQSVQVNSWGIFEMVLWNDASTGTFVYEFDTDGILKAFQIANNQINSTILSQFVQDNSSPYAGLALSANGGQNGIVWLITGDLNTDGVPATLHALDATNLANELWNSNQNGSRDQPGAFAKFVGPTVANGRVYVPTLSNSVAVYGPLPSPTSQGTPVISSVVNSASYLEGPLSPGELVTIFGASLGPSSAAQTEVVGDTVATTIGSTQVLIGGVAAPLLFASSAQINAVVPFGLAGSTTQVQVVYQGQVVTSTTVAVQPAAPAIFSLDGDGGGPGAILNQDGSINSQSNPASPGSVVVLYATGGGLTTPASIDGRLTSSPYPSPSLPISVSIEGLPAQVVYAGAAPGMVAGMLQINVVVPAGVLQEPYDQVIVTIGDYVSPSAVTVAVQ